MPNAKKQLEPEPKKESPKPGSGVAKELEELLNAKPEYNWLVIPRGALDTKTTKQWKADRNVEETFNNFIQDGFVIDKFSATPQEFIFVWKR